MTPPLTPDALEGWELVGRGANGVVFRARHAGSDHVVAVKKLHVGKGDEQALGRFRREAAAMAAVDHPAVVRVDDLIEVDGELNLIMQFVDGISLQVLRPSLSPSAALAVVGQLGAPLDAIHAVGVAHRDLKPGNVLVDRSGHCRITDFGIARFVGESMHGSGRNVVRTRTGVVLGTPAYLSPEMASGERPVDLRSDVYSLGVMAYQLLVGRLPFQGGPYELLAAHLSAQVPRPAAVVPGFPASVESVLLRALAKAPDDRYRSAGDFVVELLGAGEPEWGRLVPAELASLTEQAMASGAAHGDIHDNLDAAASTATGPWNGTGSIAVTRSGRLVVPQAAAIPVALARRRRTGRLVAVMVVAAVASAIALIAALTVLH